MAFDRREFLKRAGLTGGALAATAALPGCRTLFPPGYQPTSTILDGAATDSPIDTIVIVMSENRSFDHWLGWLGNHQDYVDAGRSQYGKFFSINANNQAVLDSPNGPVATHHMLGWDAVTNPYRGCDLSDPNHGWNAGRAQRDLGFLAPTANDDVLPAGYYEAEDLAFTRHFAKRFTVFDDYHCSLLGPTWPNRHYLHGAQSGGNKSNAFPAEGFTWPLIWEKLAAANVSAKYYYSDLPFAALYGARMTPFIAPIADYFTDCAAGTLPHVVMLDPSFNGPTQNDDHPLADVRNGQAFQRNVFKAFATSPQWQRGVYISTYDEWGGFYDHVAPPHFADDRASAVDQDDFSQSGFRVPTIMASPFAHAGLVDGRAYDHASILRFIEWRFLGAPPEGPGSANDTWFLTRRDRYASNLGASLSGSIIDPALYFDINLPIDPPSPACGTGPAPLSAMARSVLEADDPAFDELAWKTYLDRQGFKLPA